ncbi:hypothetical protein ACEQ8H_007267 [Pleosporales sp. CAS-2024a]
MQVHAVPDSERAFDSTGRRLPWAYEFADADKNQRRMPEEKGPFGKARKRGTSRAKTPTQNSALDVAQRDNDKRIDEIFASFRAENNQRSMRAASGAVATLPPSASAPHAMDAGGLSASFCAGASTNTSAKEPKEVILYGFAADVQWAAIAHYEKVSDGLIYEDYDREPYHAKLAMSFNPSSAMRASTMRSLDMSAVRRINQYVGGDSWIKVTFDSAEAAERACHYSPHNIQGYTVFAEPYRGTGPTGGDRPIHANAGGLLSQTASPNTLSSGTLGGRDSSTTASSATAIAPFSPSTTEPLFRASGAFPEDNNTAPTPTAPSQPQILTQTSSLATTAMALGPRSARATLRLKGANVKPAVFLPQEKAFLPSQPRWQQFVGSVPLIGWLIGSGGPGFIGDQVPRKEDGSFDAQKASLYWRAWYAVDACFGTDFCGARDAEYDD